MNIFERAKQLAEIGVSIEATIRRLKSEGYEEVDAHLSPSLRKELRKIRETAKGASR